MPHASWVEIDVCEPRTCVNLTFATVYKNHNRTGALGVRLAIRTSFTFIYFLSLFVASSVRMYRRIQLMRYHSLTQLGIHIPDTLMCVLENG